MILRTVRGREACFRLARIFLFAAVTAAIWAPAETMCSAEREQTTVTCNTAQKLAPMDKASPGHVGEVPTRAAREEGCTLRHTQSCSQPLLRRKGKSSACRGPQGVNLEDTAGLSPPGQGPVVQGRGRPARRGYRQCSMPSAKEERGHPTRV